MSCWAYMGQLTLWVRPVGAPRQRDWRLTLEGIYAEHGHPGYHVQDPYADWLPPPRTDAAFDLDDLDAPAQYRAVVITDAASRRGTARHDWEYANPVLLLSGVEWEQMPVAALWMRLQSIGRTRLGAMP